MKKLLLLLLLPVLVFSADPGALKRKKPFGGSFVDSKQACKRGTAEPIDASCDERSWLDDALQSKMCFENFHTTIGSVGMHQMEPSQSSINSRKIATTVEAIPGAASCIRKILAIDTQRDVTLVPLYGIIYRAFPHYKISMEALHQWLKDNHLLQVDWGSRLEVTPQFFDFIIEKLELTTAHWPEARMASLWNAGSDQSIASTMMLEYIKIVQLAMGKDHLRGLALAKGRNAQALNTKLIYFDSIIQNYYAYVLVRDKEATDAERLLMQKIEGLAFRENRKNGRRVVIPNFKQFVLEQYRQTHDIEEVADACEAKFGICRDSINISRLIKKYLQSKVTSVEQAAGVATYLTAFFSPNDRKKIDIISLHEIIHRKYTSYEISFDCLCNWLEQKQLLAKVQPLRKLEKITGLIDFVQDNIQLGQETLAQKWQQRSSYRDTNKPACTISPKDMGNLKKCIMAAKGVQSTINQARAHVDVVQRAQPLYKRIIAIHDEVEFYSPLLK